MRERKEFAFVLYLSSSTLDRSFPVSSLDVMHPTSCTIVIAIHSDRPSISAASQSSARICVENTAEHLLAIAKLDHHIWNLDIFFRRVFGSDFENHILLMLGNLLLRDRLGKLREPIAEFVSLIGASWARRKSATYFIGNRSLFFAAG